MEDSFLVLLVCRVVLMSRVLLPLGISHAVCGEGNWRWRMGEEESAGVLGWNGWSKESSASSESATMSTVRVFSVSCVNGRKRRGEVCGE